MKREMNFQMAKREKSSVVPQYQLISQVVQEFLSDCLPETAFDAQVIKHGNRGGQVRIPIAGMRVVEIFVIPKHSQSKLFSLPQLHASDTHNPTGLNSFSAEMHVTMGAVSDIRRPKLYSGPHCLYTLRGLYMSKGLSD